MKKIIKIFNKLGPGLLFAGTAIGVSHLVQSTKAGAEYGFGITWALLLAIILKYPFFKYAPKQSYLSDINQNLIITYNIIKNDVNTLISSLKEHQELHNKEYFYEQRKKFNELITNGGTDTDIASLFIYLNRTCFNGLYRENSKGEFNVPIGSYKNPLICDEMNLLSVHKILQNIHQLLTTLCSALLC